MTAIGSAATAAGPVHYVVEKLSGPGDVFLSALDANGMPFSILNSGSYLAEGFPLAAGAVHSTEWTVKFSKIGDYLLSIRLVGAQGQPLSSWEKQLSVTPSVMNLGHQVFQDGIYRGAFGVENGRAVGYTIVTGKPDAKFVVLDVTTERVLKVFDLPEAEGAWGIKTASDGKVYIGTYTKATLFQYDPVTDRVEDMGSPQSTIPGALLYEMAEDKDGNLYYGTYPDSKLYKFDPVTKQTTDLGSMVADQPYSRSIAYDAEQNALFVGVGGSKASLIKYDLATGNKTEMLPDSIRNQYKLTYDMNLVGNKLFLKMDSNFGLIVLDKNTGLVVKDFGTLAIHSRGISEKSPYGDIVYLTFGGILKAYDLQTNTITDLTTAASKIDFKANTIGWGILQLDDPNYPGYTLVGFNGNTGGGFFKYNLQNKALRITNVPLPKVAIKLHTLGRATDGKIYSAGFLPGGMGIFNPVDGTSSNNAIGQVEGMTALGSKMYFGVYPGAKIYEYDTSQAWKLNTSVVNKFELKTNYQQDRPYAMLGVPELDKVLIGTVPDYAISGGALTLYDPAANTYEVHRNIVPDQSVVSLAYKDGKVYGGTSYAGGLGTEWPYADGKLFVFDIATKTIELVTVPIPGKGAVNQLIVGPDGNIWGFAQGTFFVFDPATKQVLREYTLDAFPESVGTWRDAELETSAADGRVYGTSAGDNFFRIDIVNGKPAITLLAKGATLLTQDNYGNFYFKKKEDEASLWRYTIEDRTIAANYLTLDKQETDLYMGDTLTVTATVYPTFATRKSFTWSTSNNSVAAVNASGLITPIALGTATITATTADGKFSSSVLVHVKERTQSTYELSIDTPIDAVTETVPTALPVLIKTQKSGKEPLTGAYYTLERTGGPGTVAFQYTDGEGVETTFVNQGDYGKPGLTLPVQALEEKNWRLTFSAAGSYSVAVKLKDALGSTLAEASRSFTVQAKPARSVYRFSSTVTSVTYNVYTSFPVTLDSSIVSLEGYKGAKIVIENLSASTGNLKFQLQDGATSYAFTNAAQIRPAGFNLSPQYRETMPWTIQADQPGAYKIHWKLLTADGQVIAQNDLLLVSTYPNAVPLLNPGFEQPQANDGTVPGWTAWSTTARNVMTAHAVTYSGERSLKFIDDNASATNAIQTVNASGIAGKTYQASFLMYNKEPSAGLQIYLQFYNNAGTRVGVAYVGANPLIEWTPVVISGVAPAGTTLVNLMAYSTSGARMTAYLDDATLSYKD
ncbi:Ig-like domain-containing protein [Paenibacillus nasutitermitis]|nr:Ig-like domain-containing protein [Paenibacillus nasutitermitis]